MRRRHNDRDRVEWVDVNMGWKNPEVRLTGGVSLRERGLEAQGVPGCPTRLPGPRVPFEAGRGL